MTPAEMIQTASELCSLFPAAGPGRIERVRLGEAAHGRLLADRNTITPSAAGTPLTWFDAPVVIDAALPADGVAVDLKAGVTQ